MSRYIDADALKADGWCLTRDYNEHFVAFTEYEDLDDVQTADVVKVVRCKECKHSRSDEYEPLWCYRSEVCEPVKADHFCGYGERKDEVEE